MKKKKINGFAKLLIIALSIVIIILILLKIFLPDLFGPRNLGVKITNEAYLSAVEKLNFKTSKENIKGEYDDYIHSYGEVNEINVSLTSEEITSFINEIEKEYFAIKNVQILINADNSITMSFSMNVNKVLKAIDGIPIQYRNKDNLPVSFVIPDNVNIYTRCSGEFKDNKVVNFNILEFEIDSNDVMIYIKQNYGIDILRDEINDQLNYLNELTGSYIESGKFVDGNFIYVGKFPSSYSVEKK